MNEISFSITLDDLCFGKRLDHASLMDALKSSQNQNELWDRLAAATLSAICEEMQRPLSEIPPKDDSLYRDFIAARRNLDEIARSAFANINFVKKAAEQHKDFQWYPAADYAIAIVEAVRRLAMAHRAIRDSEVT